MNFLTTKEKISCLAKIYGSRESLGKAWFSLAHKHKDIRTRRMAYLTQFSIRALLKPMINKMADASSVILLLIGTLRSEDGDGRETVAEKVNSRSFNLHRDYSNSLTLSNVGEPSSSRIPKKKGSFLRPQERKYTKIS